MDRPLLIVALLAALAAGAGAGDGAPPGREAMIRFHVRLPQHRAHRVHVEMTLGGLQGDHVEIAMPVWTPGSYLVREFARHVLDLRASRPGGSPLEARKTNKNTWRVATGGSREVIVAYTLYAHELSVRTSHVDDTHAFLSPAATFFRVPGREHEPHRVTVEPPPGWSVHTALPADGDGWLARDFDTLVDSPVEVGPHRVLCFTVREVPHRLVLAGAGEVDEEQLARDVTAICEETASIFDCMPFDDYLFLLLLVDQGGGGLEHASSSVNMTSRWKLHDDKAYRRLLSLLAHEYFHAWNVKRFRPAALGPFDYDGEVYTTDLWVAEGLTSYYDDLVAVRARFVDGVASYLDELAEGFQKLHERPGAARTSLTRSSWDTWIKQYRPDENSLNSTVSYYTKGALVGLLLDLRIRRLTGGERTLADALRLGWERYAAQGVGYPDGALGELAADVTGSSFAEFFARWVDGTEPLDPGPELAWVGLELSVTPAKSDRALPTDDEGFKVAPDLRIETADGNGLCRVSAVAEDGPAFEAGLNVDDVILAVDGMRVHAGDLADRLDRTRGETVELTIYRGESLRVLSVRPERRRLETWKLEPLTEPTDAQRAAFTAWTGWELPARPEGKDDGADEGGGTDETDAGDAARDE